MGTRRRARGARRTLAEALAEREVVKMADMVCGAGARAFVCAGGGGTRSNGAVIRRETRARARSRAVVFSIVWMGLTVRIRGVCKPMCARSMDGPRRARRCGDGRGVLFVYGLLFCLCMV
jgi:hypothetical protein